MLFIQSNSLALSLSRDERLRLLEALARRGPAPFIRAARGRLFQMLVSGGGAGAFVSRAAAELERECAARQESEGEADYTPGDLFFADDCVLTLVFGEGAGGGVRAGVVYDISTAEPLARLGRFCREVREALAEVRGGEGGGDGPPADLPDWQAQGGRLSEGLARFIAVQPAEFTRAAAALRGGRELTRAAALMEHQAVRSFLRRVQELRREGYTPRRLLREAGTLGGVSTETLLDAGLLVREVRVSCRKSGHALFDLPTPDSLAAITISKAKCSQCAAPVADEVIEETLNPSTLAVALLEDGRWLSNRVYQIVRSLGVPDSEIASGPTSPHGESYLAVEVCGTSFLFAARDGDLTPAVSRRVAEAVEETEASHLVVVTTGAAEDEGRMRLYEFAWRRARDGRDLGTTLVEGLGGARAQIERAFAAAVQRELSRGLFTLDAALGFSAARFVLDWFRLARAAGETTRAAELPAPLLDRQVAS